jgi:transcriptional regulator with XRE-family HTH domain
METDQRALDPDLYEVVELDTFGPEIAEYLWTEFNADIGAALKKARKARSLTQADIAEAMGIKLSRVRQIESTKGVRMTLDVLARYVAAIGCRLDVDIFHPETDKLISNVPVMPMTFFSVEEVERRS